MQLDQFDIALGPNPRRGDLCVHVAEHQIGEPDIGPQHVPYLLVSLAGFVDLDGLETQAFGVAIDGIDDAAAAGRVRADVEVVSRRDRKAGQLPAMERRNHEGHVRAVRGAGVRIIVHEDVARLDRLAAFGKQTAEAADVAGDRARLQRRALLGLGQLAVLHIDERSAEILRFADDAGIGHAHELVAHLDRNVLQRTLNDARGDRIDFLIAGIGAFDRARIHAAPRAFMIKFPLPSATIVHPGGTTVVLSVCKIIAGPSTRLPTGSSSRR